MTHPNTTADPDATERIIRAGDPDALTMARFPNRSGAIVRVVALPDPAPSREYAADCTGCLDSSGFYERDRSLIGHTMTRAREWAVKHSEQCRALPAQSAESSARSDCLETAARLLDRADRMVFTETSTPRLLNAADQSMVNMLARLAGAAAALAGAYQADRSALIEHPTE